MFISLAMLEPMLSVAPNIHEAPPSPPFIGFLCGDFRFRFTTPSRSGDPARLLAAFCAAKAEVTWVIEL